MPNNNKYNRLLNCMIVKQHTCRKSYIREISVWVGARREGFKEEANILDQDGAKERNSQWIS